MTSKRKANMKYTKRKKLISSNRTREVVLSITEKEEAYPWEKEASKNREKQSPLSEHIQKLMEGAVELYPLEMKSMLYETINYPDSIIKKIDDKIGREGKKYICINCECSPRFTNNRRC